MTQRDIFKKQLPYYMNLARMNQAELAAAMKVTKATVSCWVSGRAFPRIDKIQRIADVLGCTTDDLLKEPALVLGYPSLPLRNTITDEELILVQAYREAKPEYQNVVLEILSNHKKEE